MTDHPNSVSPWNENLGSWTCQPATAVVADMTYRRWLAGLAMDSFLSKTHALTSRSAATCWANADTMLDMEDHPAP